MGLSTTKPVRVLDKKQFEELIEKKRISVAPHALDHISTAQRKVFKDDDLRKTVANETPRKVYQQENGNYAVYYRTSEGYRKLIIACEKETITIITFMNVTEIPRVIIDTNENDS